MKTLIFGDNQLSTSKRGFKLPEKVRYLMFANISGGTIDIFLNGNPTAIPVTSGGTFKIPYNVEGVEITDELKLQSSTTSKFVCFVLF